MGADRAPAAAARWPTRLRQPRDPRSIRAFEAVAADVLAAPENFAELLDAILDDNPLVRMRAAYGAALRWSYSAHSLRTA